MERGDGSLPAKNLTDSQDDKIWGEEGDEDEGTQGKKSANHHTSLAVFGNKISVQEGTEETSNTSTLADAGLPRSCQLKTRWGLLGNTNESTILNLE